MNFKRFYMLLAVSVFSILIMVTSIGCSGGLDSGGGGNGGAPITSITIEPSSVTLAKGQVGWFGAFDQEGKNVTERVTWSVSVPAESMSDEISEDLVPDIGTVGPMVPYVVPSILPPDGVVTITASYQDVRGTANVNLTVGSEITFSEKSVLDSTTNYGFSPSVQALLGGSLYVASIEVNIPPLDLQTFMKVSKSVDGGETFTHSDNLDPNNIIKDPLLAKDSAGNIYLAYLVAISAESFGGNILKSTDGGATFIEMGFPTIPPNKTLNFIRMRIDSQDNFYFLSVTRDYTPGNQNADLNLTKLDTELNVIGFWEVDHLDANSTADIFGYPDLLIMPDDSVVIVYDRKRGEFDNARDVWFAKPAPGGVISSKVRVTPNEVNYPLNPVIAYDSNETIYVAWVNLDAYVPIPPGSSASIKYAISMNGGASFSGPVTLVVPSGNYVFQSPVAIGIDGLDNINLAYYDWVDPKANIKLIRSTDYGASWTVPVKINASPGNANVINASLAFPKLSILADHTGRVYVLGALSYSGNSGPWNMIFSIGE